MIKIGKKNFNVKIDNQVIWDIEENLNGEISAIMKGVGEMRTKDLALLIFHSIKDDITCEEFAKQIKLDQYIAAATVVIQEIHKAFGLTEKKK